MSNRSNWNHMSTITITKAEAARRQIDTAITLWFRDADPISIHTLACAGLEILHDLGKPLGQTAMQYDPCSFRKETFKEWIQLVNKSRNFLKHADRDPLDTLGFNPTANKYLLADCVDTCLRVSGGQTPIMKAFWGYFTLHHSQYFDPIMIEVLPLELRELPKEQFFVEFMSVIQAPRDQ